MVGKLKIPGIGTYVEFFLLLSIIRWCFLTFPGDRKMKLTCKYFYEFSGDPLKDIFELYGIWARVKINSS